MWTCFLPTAVGWQGLWEHCDDICRFSTLLYASGNGTYSFSGDKSLHHRTQCGRCSHTHYNHLHNWAHGDCANWRSLSLFSLCLQQYCCRGLSLSCCEYHHCGFPKKTPKCSRLFCIFKQFKLQVTWFHFRVHFLFLRCATPLLDFMC